MARTSTMIARIPEAVDNGSVQDGRFCFVTVAPGDFRRRYLELEGHDGACNRPIDAARVRLYGQSLESICTTTIALLDVNGRMFILDGQHRLAAISAHATAPMRIAARILTREDVARVAPSLADYMKVLGAQKPMGVGGRLSVFRSQSPWVEHAPRALADSMTFNPSKTRISWLSLLGAVIGAERSHKKGYFVSFSATNVDAAEVFNVWLRAPESAVREVFECVEPWIRVAERARLMHKVRFLASATCLQTWILIAKINADSPAMRTLPERLLEFPALPSILRARDAETANALVEALNYKRKQENRVSLVRDIGQS